MYAIEYAVLFALSCFLSIFLGDIGIFTIFGVLAFSCFLAHCLFDSLYVVYVQLIGRLTLKKRLHSYGKWAVVTGCTRGMGREFSLQLAECGLDVALVGRNMAVMEKLESEIRSRFHVETVIIQADFSSTSAQQQQQENLYLNLKEKLKSLEGGIGILVNNVGVFYLPQLFHEVSEKDILDTVYVNMIPALRLSHMVIKDDMLPRNKGLVVFLGSFAALKPFPFFNAYAASKAYTGHLAKVLYEDYKHTGIYVQGLAPSFVATDMAKYLTNVSMPSARTYVKNAITSLGMKPFTSAYIPHMCLVALVKSIPDWTYSVYCRILLEKFRKKENVIRNNN